MKWKKLGLVALLALVAGCSDAPLEPVVPAAGPQAHLGAPGTSCPLAQLPESARVLLCFTTTLQPGVWHGWLLELAEAQPHGDYDGDFSRSRLNHAYQLAEPQGFPYWNDPDPWAPAPLSENIHTFQAEFNGVQWFDVLRINAASAGTPQTVPLVVFYADATSIAGDIEAAVAALLAAGVVNGGQATALTRKIHQATKLLGRDNTAEAIAVLQDFIQQVNDLTGAVLTSSQASQLITWARYVIQSI